MKRRRRSKIAACLCLAVAVSVCGFRSAYGTTFEELDATIAASRTVVTEALNMPEHGIPRELLSRSRGIAVFPNLLKFGLVVGMSYGDGIVVRRDEATGQWSKPSFFKIRSGSLGLQVGAQSTDLVLLIMSERAMQRLLEDKFVLGADISVAAGPVGRGVSAETNTAFDSGILSYSRARGLFAGVAVTGATMEPDKAANALYHGEGVTVQDVFYEDRGALTENATLLRQSLQGAVQPYGTTSGQ